MPDILNEKSPLPHPPPKKKKIDLKNVLGSHSISHLCLVDCVRIGLSGRVTKLSSFQAFS